VELYSRSGLAARRGDQCCGHKFAVTTNFDASADSAASVRVACPQQRDAGAQMRDACVRLAKVCISECRCVALLCCVTLTNFVAALAVLHMSRGV
jgi:hypothetical protein